MNGGTGAVSASCSHPTVAGQGSSAGTVTRPWPLQTRLPLAALPTAPACARGHVRSVAHEWGLGHLADVAELLVSELVTNAVKASDRLSGAIVPVVLLGLVSDKVSLVIRVWDASAELPIRSDAE